ncbi:MAG: PrgI family protein [Candidatus Gracilibacteria bacterium]|nr:PrgI family protein [Candidatus Gracilibacteria bacterium]
MQYKIPVQIENEDPIILGLSLRQLAIIVAGGGIAYSLFVSIAQNTGPEIAALPSIAIFLVAVLIAVFKYSEMTFIPFILAFVRFKTNLAERKWDKGIDSFQPIDIGFLSNIENKVDKKIDFSSKIDKIKELDDKISKI